jgi:hypothetical protein
MPVRRLQPQSHHPRPVDGRKPERWRKVETAKRRLVAQLISLGLQVIPKTVDEDTGLAFDFIGIDLEGKRR